MKKPEFFNIGLPKWPALAVVGKPVTPEQAMEEVEPIDEFAKIFSSATVKYRGYYFCNVHGQGTVSRIFSPQKLLIFQL